jgi:hypothetical protein
MPWGCAPFPESRHFKEPIKRLYSIAVREGQVHQYGSDMGRVVTCVCLFMGKYLEAIGAAPHPHHTKGPVSGIDERIANSIGVGTLTHSASLIFGSPHGEPVTYLSPEGI